MREWEYKTIVQVKDPKKPSTSQLTEYDLNKIGCKGWELVAVVDDGKAWHCVFKRVGRVLQEPVS